MDMDTGDIPPTIIAPFMSASADITAVTTPAAATTVVVGITVVGGITAAAILVAATAGTAKLFHCVQVPE
jgi:hypothetical protein